MLTVKFNLMKTCCNLNIIIYFSYISRNYTIYSTKNTIVAEDVYLTSTIIDRRFPISFVIVFKTYVKQHPKKLPIVIQHDNTTVMNFTFKELSPKELYFTFEHHTQKNTTNVSISIKNSIVGWVKFSQILHLVEADELEIAPIFGELQKFPDRFLKNGSFGMSVEEELRFDFHSLKYDLINVSVVKRLDHPKFCFKEDENILKKIGIDCQNNSLPVIRISEEKTNFVFDPKTIGIYTIIIYIKNKITKANFYQTVRTTNFLIVEEPITLACIQFINNNDGTGLLLAGAWNQSIGLNVMYHWTYSNQFDVKTRK